MNKTDLLNMIINKTEQIKQLVESDYDKGKLTFAEKNNTLFYLDQLKYDVQRTFNMLSLPN